MLATVAGLPARIKGRYQRWRNPELQVRPGLVREINTLMTATVFALMVDMLYEEFGPDWRVRFGALSEQERRDWVAARFPDDWI